MRKTYVVILLKGGHDHWNREFFFVCLHICLFLVKLKKILTSPKILDLFFLNENT